MQPHSRKSESSEAFVSFEVKLVFESCDLQVANGGEHSQVCDGKEEFEKRKAGPLGAECAFEESKKRRLVRMTRASPLANTTSRNASTLDNYCLCATKSHGTSADTTGVLS